MQPIAARFFNDFSRVKALAFIILNLNSYPCFPQSSVDNLISINVLPLKEATDRNNLWRAIAKIGPSSDLHVAASQTLTEAVRAKCGSAPKDLVDQLLLLNQGVNIAPILESRSLKFISCPYWHFGPDGKGVEIQTRKGDVIEDLAKRLMGSDGAQTLETIRSLNQTSFNSDGVVLSDGSIVVPYVSKPILLPISTSATSIDPIKNSILNALPPKARAIAKLAGSPLLPGEYRLVAYESVEVNDPKEECGKGFRENQWPYDLTSLSDAISKARSTLTITPDPGVILIADTGLDVKDKFFDGSLWSNKNIQNGYPNASTFKKDLHGASMVTQLGDDVGPPPVTYQLMEHGTDVARVIIEPSTQIGSFKGIFRIAVARLNDPDPPYKISVDSVPTAVAYAGYIQADVVNLSVVIGSASEGLKNILSTSHALVVAAAGNGGARIEKLNIFPPGYADMHRMIVVGAHDWDGEITTFSNRGADILAPGCAVPVTTSSGSRRYVSGTSFAAPLVSQTAAQMVAVGIPNFPALLRSRLLASAKYEQRLEDVTRYAGVLNPERAIRAKEDSIWLRGATSPIFGTLDSAENWSCQALGESYRSTNLVKVETVGPEKQLRLWISGAEPGEFSRVMCSSGFDNPNLRFKSTEASEFETISWKDVQDVVPRLQAQ